MEHVKIVITTGNAAFDDEPASEIARILRNLAERFEHDGIPPEAIRDANGNVCGSVEVQRALED